MVDIIQHIPHDIFPFVAQHFGEKLLYKLTTSLLKDKIYNCLSQALFWKLKTENIIQKNINNKSSQFYNADTWLDIYHITKECSAYDNPLSYIAEYGHYEALEILLMKYDPSNNCDIFKKAAENQNMHKILEIILADGRLCISTNNNIALKYAIHYGRIKAVKLLVNGLKNVHLDDNIIINATIGRCLTLMTLLYKTIYGNDVPLSVSEEVTAPVAQLMNYILDIGDDPSELVKYMDINSFSSGNTEPKSSVFDNIMSGTSISEKFRLGLFFFESKEFFDCFNNQSKITKYLLCHNKIDVSVQDNQAFINAVTHNELDIVRMLLKSNKIDPNCRNGEAIIIATKFGYLNIVECLLNDNRVNPSLRNNQAIIDCVDTNLLIKRGKQLLSFNEYFSIIYNRIKKNGNKKHLKILSLLLKNPHIDPSAQNNKIIINAVKSKNYKAVKLLLNDNRINPLDQNYAALECCKSIKIMKLFLKDMRIDPCYNNNFLLINATKEGNIKMVDLLLKDPRIRNININTDNMADLPWYIEVLIKYPKDDIVKILNIRKQERMEELRKRFLKLRDLPQQ
jgi:hypothetical protein